MMFGLFDLCGTARLLTQLIVEIRKMADTLQAEIDALTAKVAANTSVTASAVTLINGFAAQLAAAVAAAQAAGATPAQLQALTDLQAALDSSDTDLAAAVASNTPTP